MDDWRRQLWTHASGKILEVGTGTGRNQPFYPEGAEVTAIDLSPAMLERARLRLEQLRREGRLRAASVDLREMDAQAMEFPDRSFDTVLATCVFCTVPDPVAGMREMRRVCKPDGKILLLEHMRSERRGWGSLLDALDPLTARIVGTHVNRRTMDNLAAAGIRVERVENLMLDILRLIVARP